jgi:hypothetical protein
MKIRVNRYVENYFKSDMSTYEVEIEMILKDVFFKIL